MYLHAAHPGAGQILWDQQGCSCRRIRVGRSWLGTVLQRQKFNVLLFSEIVRVCQLRLEAGS